ncbi:MAG: hypothetical protein U0835_17880 [Isosphaeraceae bacterium]
MSTTKQLESAPAVPPEDLAELEAAVADLVRGRRDRAAMERAARDLEEGREETRRRLGETDAAVELTDRDGA